LFFQTSEILAALAAVFEGYNNEEKAAQLKKVWSRPMCPYLNAVLLTRRDAMLTPV